MDKYESGAVPFQAWGNYSVLTDEQLLELPWLRDFIDRFPSCFERNELNSLFVFWPEGKADEVDAPK
jgi:hypothetical protein